MRANAPAAGSRYTRVIWRAGHETRRASAIRLAGASRWTGWRSALGAGAVMVARTFEKYVSEQTAQRMAEAIGTDPTKPRDHKTEFSRAPEDSPGETEEPTGGRTHRAGPGGPRPARRRSNPNRDPRAEGAPSPPAATRRSPEAKDRARRSPTIPTIPMTPRRAPLVPIGAIDPNAHERKPVQKRPTDGSSFPPP